MARIERLTTTDTLPELRRLELARRRLDADTLELIAAAEAVSRLTGGAVPERPVRLLTIGQVAERLSASEGFVKNLLASGRLTRLKVGELTRVTESELESYIAGCGQ